MTQENSHAAEQEAVRVRKAALLLDCSVGTIYKMIKSGQLKTCKVGDDLRVRRDSIKQLIAA